MVRAIVVATLAVMAISLAGCGTFSAVCGPINDHVFYRGVRLDVESAKEGGPRALMAADIPFSAIADTILLPYATYISIVGPAIAAGDRFNTEEQLPLGKTPKAVPTSQEGSTGPGK